MSSIHPPGVKYPRLRTKVYKGAGGQAYVYYVYDMRGTREPDVRLGTDHAATIARWDEIHNKKARIAGTIQEAFNKWRAEELPNYGSKVTREGYTRNLDRIVPVFGAMFWEEFTLPDLRQYLNKRSAKTQGNREMSVFS